MGGGADSDRDTWGVSVYNEESLNCPVKRFLQLLFVRRQVRVEDAECRGLGRALGRGSPFTSNLLDSRRGAVNSLVTGPSTELSLDLLF